VSDAATLSTPDLAAMLREIQELPRRVQERLLKGAVATGCSVIRQEAILRAPEYTGKVSEGHPPPGTLKKAIYQTRLVDKCTPTREVWKVDVRRGKTAQTTKRGGGIVNLDAYYASWVEYGHYAAPPHGLTKTAKAVGKAIGVIGFVPAHPYMRPAFEAKKNEALQAMGRYIAVNLPAATSANRFIKAAA
jgi:hypothetical protein